MDPPRILIVDDQPDNLIILRARLEARGYITRAAHDGEEALAALGALGSSDAVRPAVELPDLILLDVRLPKIGGLEVVRRIKQDSRLPFIPVIMQTALDASEDKIHGFEAGADDYITKPINFPELEARVRSLLRIKSLQTEIERRQGELEALNDQLVRLAQTDVVTGIENRRRVEERLEEMLESSLRSGQPFSVMMCDLDGFKMVNDTYGHQAGDAVLQQVAQLLRAKVRGNDRVGRYGGEEFLVIFAGATASTVTVAAERLRKAVEACTFNAGGTPIHRTMSCGIASWPDSATRDVRALVRAADEALYRAKDRGRNCVVQSTETEQGSDTSVLAEPQRDDDYANAYTHRPDTARPGPAVPADRERR
jgi:two-component system, cell cycle response regulator